MFCIYGKATGKWEKCTIHRMNKYGVALTPRKQWYYFPYRINFWFKTPKKNHPGMTTFTLSHKGIRFAFG